MKKIIFSCFVLFLFSCQKKEQQSVETETPIVPEVKKEVREGNKSLPGYTLITGSDCLSCHKDSQTFVGPSYADIADKYSDADEELLASKIIEGGSGVWGQVPMQAHPNVSKEHAKEMVKYILSFKK